MGKEAEVKPFKTIDQQIEILKARGLIIEDNTNTQQTLQRINYYRLSGYTLTLRKDNRFYEGVSFDQIMQIYNFDAELRSLLLLGLESIEIQLRANIGYYHGKKHGPLGYNNSEIFSNRESHNKFKDSFENLLRENSRNEIFIRHHRDHKGGEFPIWVVAEVLSFGALSKLFSIIDVEVQKEICQERYRSIPPKYIASWLHCLSILRNICAHRARLYNRNFPMGPKFSKSDKDMFVELGVTRECIGKRFFFYIFVMGKIINDEQLWNYILDEFEKLLIKYPFVKVSYLGFPEKWREVLFRRKLHIIKTTVPAKPLKEA